MGAYIEQEDIEARFGTANVLKWSNLDNTTAEADEARIEVAIEVAEDHVENRFRGGRYAVPFESANGLPKVVDWMAKLAGIWLYEHRGLSDDNAEGNLLSDMKADVEKEIDKYLAGEARLNAELSCPDSPTAPVVVGND